MSVRVLVVDDLPEVRALVRSALRLTKQVEIVGEADSSGEAARMAAELDPQAVVLDLRLRDTTGRHTYIRLREVVPNSRFVIYSAYESDRQWYEDHGVAFVEKEADLQLLVGAVTG